VPGASSRFVLVFIGFGHPKTGRQRDLKMLHNLLDFRNYSAEKWTKKSILGEHFRDIILTADFYSFLNGPIGRIHALRKSNII
jgi:hypothetical protein